MSKDISQEQKNIFADNLNRLLSESGKNQSDLVTHFGITASTVSDWCNAKKYPRVDKMQMLADYFGIKKSDLTEKQKPRDEVLEELKKMFKEMTNEEIPFNRVIPVYRSVSFIDNALHFEGFVKRTFTEDVEDFENHIALLIPSNELEPEFSATDIAIIHLQSELIDNRYFYLFTKDNKARIRKVIFTDNDNQVILKADNPQLDVLICSVSDIKVVGIVIVIQRNKKL